MPNYPTLAFVNASGVVHGLLDSHSGTYTIDAYQSDECDATGYGEGQTWLGNFSVTIPSGGGTEPFNHTLSNTPDGGSYVTTWMLRK